MICRMCRSQGRRKPEAIELGGEGDGAFKSPGLCCILSEAERDGSPSDARLL